MKEKSVCFLKSKMDLVKESNSSKSSQDKEMNIYLKVTKTVALKVSKTDTIRKLKAAMREKEGVSENIQKLYYGDKCLKDEEKLIDCGIQENSALHLVLLSSGLVKLTVKITSRQKTLEVQVKRNDTVHNLKLIIQAKAEIQSDTYTLFYAGKKLEDSFTLASYNINEESVLEFVPRNFEIFGRFFTGEVTTLDVCQQDTVSDVKSKIRKKLDDRISYSRYLIYAGKLLKDDQNLAQLGVEKGSTIHIIVGSPCFVKLSELKGAPKLPRQTTIGHLKKVLTRQLNKPVKEIFLRGKALQDDQTMADCAIRKVTVLTVV